MLRVYNQVAMPATIWPAMMNGVDAFPCAGNSVCAFVHGFLPYLYIEAPTRDFGPEDCESLRCALNVSGTTQLKFSR